MSKNRNPKKADGRLNIKKIAEEFERVEISSPRHKGTFKIDKPFEEAVTVVLKAKPKAKKDSSNR